ncbi:MAG: hypothetical protein WCD20_21045 [Rhodomicrobium sp.]
MRSISALLTLALLLPFPLAAQAAGDSEGDLCKEPIQSAGDAFHLLRAGRKSAIRHWQDEVFKIYGDQFTDYRNARGPEGGAPELRCDPARVDGGHTIFDLKRCVVVAQPCREPY